MSYAIPIKEDNRLSNLRTYNLSSKKNKYFSEITSLASKITKMPVSLISLVEEDEVWFKGTTGMDVCTGDKKLSFCNYAVESRKDIYVIENTLKHPRFKEHPYANLNENPIIFYAGICLVSKEGHKLGTLCVIDHKENKWTSSHENTLRLLANQTIKLIELNKINKDLKKTQKKLKRQNKNLKDFAGNVSHDMKMPLANMIVTSDIIKLKYEKLLDDKGLEYLSYLKKSSLTLSDYITGLLDHYESNNITPSTKANKETFSFKQLLEEVVELLNINIDCSINFPKKDIEISCNRSILEQILLNLIANSIKYNDKENTTIKISSKRKKGKLFIKVDDNGIGIPKNKLNKVFKLFSTAGNLDRYGEKGNGIGLSTVKNLVEELGGNIKVKSKLGIGTTFIFSIVESHS